MYVVGSGDCCRRTRDRRHARLGVVAAPRGVERAREEEVRGRRHALEEHDGNVALWRRQVDAELVRCRADGVPDVVGGAGVQLVLGVVQEGERELELAAAVRQRLGEGGRLTISPSRIFRLSHSQSESVDRDIESAFAAGARMRVE